MGELRVNQAIFKLLTISFISLAVLNACGTGSSDSALSGLTICPGDSTAASSSCGDGSCAFSYCHTPAFGAHDSLWGELEPTDTGQLPANRDTTYFTELSDFEPHPYWKSLDIANGWIFTVASRRLQVWDARSNPANPTRRYDRGFRDLVREGLTWAADPHAFLIFNDIDVTDDGSRFALVGINSVGTAIYDSSAKTSPRFKYQDHGRARSASKVYVAAINNRNYAFSVSTEGVFAYDMDAAVNLSGFCVEGQSGDGPDPSSACPGVYQGRISSRTFTMGIGGVDEFIAVSSGHVVKGFEIYNVADPARERLLMTGLTSSNVYTVNMWKQNNNIYLGLSQSTSMAIYDVSCLKNGPCNLPSPLWQRSMSGGSGSKIIFSRAGNGTPFLYVGHDSACQSGLQNEWLYDVRDPASPRDITPPGTAVVSGESISYWGWYYRANGTHGFNRVAPHMGKFYGDHFYRAAKTIFDIHRWHPPTDLPPVPTDLPNVDSININPDPALLSQPIRLTAQGVTGEGPLYMAWQVYNDQGDVVDTALDLNPFTWVPSPDLPVGEYQARFLVENNFDGVYLFSQPFTVLPAVSLGFSETASTISHDVLDKTAGIQFQLASQGDSMWTWDFGDGTVETYINAEHGKNPIHFYREPGNYNVRVHIASPSNPAGITSDAQEVRVLVKGNPGADQTIVNASSCLSP